MVGKFHFQLHSLFDLLVKKSKGKKMTEKFRATSNLHFGFFILSVTSLSNYYS